MMGWDGGKGVLMRCDGKRIEGNALFLELELELELRMD